MTLPNGQTHRAPRRHASGEEMTLPNGRTHRAPRRHASGEEMTLPNGRTHRAPRRHASGEEMTLPNGRTPWPARCLAAAVLACAAVANATSPGAWTIQPTERHAVRVTILTDGLEHPWSLAFLPDGRMLVTERPGRLRYVGADGRLDPTPIEGLPATVAEAGQGGLHDVALHPGFARNRIVYIAYAGKSGRRYGTELARGRLDGHRLEDVEVLFRAQPKSYGGRHFGGRVVLDGKGHVFLTLGDRGDRPRAQDLGDHAGSVIRLAEDGGVPPDNPFVSTDGARPEIFSLGNRNVQGAALNPWTGELWTHEHGPQGGDEVNVIRAGANYGWPVITYGKN